MDQPDLGELERRPVRYWNVDGLPELTLGIMWMVWGAAWIYGETLPPGWRSGLYWLIVPPALALGMAALAPLIRRIKRHVTFPRTGYVEWKRAENSTRRRIAAAIVIVAVALAVIVPFGKSASLAGRMPAVIGVILSLSFVALSVAQRAPHLLAVAALAVAATLAVTSLAFGTNALSWLFVLLGAGCTVLGAGRFLLFVRAHPVAPREGL